MINELHMLHAILLHHGIEPKAWSSKYHELPNATTKAPCLRLALDDEGWLRRIESLSPEHVKNLRKYGDNAGTFPAFNLSPLYRISKETQKQLDEMASGKKPVDLHMIRSLCTRSNWPGSVTNKLDTCLRIRATQLKEIIVKTEGEGCAAVKRLWSAPSLCANQ